MVLSKEIPRVEGGQRFARRGNGYANLCSAIILRWMEDGCPNDFTQEALELYCLCLDLPVDKVVAEADKIRLQQGKSVVKSRNGGFVYADRK